ncbi:hypothetical protein EV193_105305 [Herbihabitans rhizosphaerae]|uniref:Uncharacterized protein n=1 Tax=Herbihabitans rhizosphaerae TaxID=1872711 RepID=A0A4Q7KN63_9PSEU|nr:hypothetical protein [Herbihabitans rhizosphaerae]RZS37747.1 hypothetical protein EV193_105305 [Herbihabitans rhizosphaerae]
MLIAVIEVAGDPPLVRFTCAAGTATVRWDGDPPRAGERHHVELELDDSRVSIIPTEARRPSIVDTPDGVRITGTAEAVVAGVLSVRLAPDCVIDVELGTRREPVVGQGIELRAPHPVAYPYLV